jgi:NitT/TauT family transport system substrate-binding protein
MTIHRRAFLKLSAGTAVASAGLGIGAPAVLRAATPVKMTLPWLPLGTFSYPFVANKNL